MGGGCSTGVACSVSTCLHLPTHGIVLSAICPLNTINPEPEPCTAVPPFAPPPPPPPAAALPPHYQQPGLPRGRERALHATKRRVSGTQGCGGEPHSLPRHARDILTGGWEDEWGGQWGGGGDPTAYPATPETYSLVGGGMSGGASGCGGEPHSLPRHARDILTGGWGGGGQWGSAVGAGARAG